jgi:hypothetical protein
LRFVCGVPQQAAKAKAVFDTSILTKSYKEGGYAEEEVDAVYRSKQVGP